MKNLKKNIKNNFIVFLSKPKFIIILAIIFLIVSILSSFSVIEMLINREKLLKENFENNYFLFIVLLMTNIGLTSFFYYLGLSLLKFKNWSRYFILGSSFVSIISVLYKVIMLFLVLFSENNFDIKMIEYLSINCVYLLIYVIVIKYFLLLKIEMLFDNKLSKLSNSFDNII